MDDPLLKIIPGDVRQRAKNLNRVSDLEKNIDLVRREFISKPEVCHYLVKHIIMLRRGIELEKNTAAFYDLLDRYLDVILEHYDLRWLISVCDTIVDTGSATSKGAAMCVVITVNNLNICETLRDIMQDGNINPDKLNANPKNKRPTWGGMITLDMYRGDTVYNMQTRMNKVVSECPLVSKIWNEIKTRLNQIPELPANQLGMANKDPRKKGFFV